MGGILPKADEVKSEIKDSRTAQQRRNQGLSDEESRLVRSINTLRDEERAEKSRIENEIRQAEVRKNTILAELPELERRKAVAMEPIEVARKEIDRRLGLTAESASANKAESERLDRRSQGIDSRDIAVSEKERVQSAREIANSEKEQDLLKRETTLLEAETAHSTKVRNDRAELTHREGAVARDLKDLDERTKRLDEREARQKADHDAREKRLTTGEEELKAGHKSLADEWTAHRDRVAADKAKLDQREAAQKKRDDELNARDKELKTQHENLLNMEKLLNIKEAELNPRAKIKST